MERDCSPPTNGWETWCYVPEKTFDDHLALLRADGWDVLDVARLLRVLEDPDELPASDPYRLTRLAIGPDTDLAAELTSSPSR